MSTENTQQLPPVPGSSSRPAPNDRPTSSDRPAPSNRPARTKVLIGAGTALKAGFFFALGATLFSLLVTVVVAIIAVILGINFSSDLRDLLGI